MGRLALLAQRAALTDQRIIGRVSHSRCLHAHARGDIEQTDRREPPAPRSGSNDGEVAVAAVGRFPFYRFRCGATDDFGR
jgi:hypothetical protein